MTKLQNELFKLNRKNLLEMSDSSGASTVTSQDEQTRDHHRNVLMKRIEAHSIEDPFDRKLIYGIIVRDVHADPGSTRSKSSSLFKTMSIKEDLQFDDNEVDGKILVKQKSKHGITPIKFSNKKRVSMNSRKSG